MSTQQIPALRERVGLAVFLARDWPLVSVIVTICLALGGIAIWMTTPVYRVTVSVLPAESKSSVAKLGAALGGLGSLGSLVGLSVGDDQNTVEALGVLKSRAFTEDFIREHGIMQRLYASQYDPQHGTYRPDLLGRVPTLYDAYRRFERKVRHVEEDHKTGIISLDIDWTNPVEGASWANAMIQRVNEVMRSRALREAEASIDQLQVELRDARTVELQAAIARTIDTYVKTRALAKVRMDYAYRVIDPAMPTSPRYYITPDVPIYLGVAAGCGLLISSLAVQHRGGRRMSRAPATTESCRDG